MPSVRMVCELSDDEGLRDAGSKPRRGEIGLSARHGCRMSRNQNGDPGLPEPWPGPQDAHLFHA